MSLQLAALHPRHAWSRLTRLGAWGSLGQIALTASGFLVSAAVARSGGPAALGVFTLVQGVTLLVAGLLKASLGDPLVIDAHRGRRLDGLAVAAPVLLGHLGLGLLAATAWLLAGGRLRGLQAPTDAELALAVLLPLASFQELARSVRLAGTGERRLCTGDVLVALARVAALAACFHQLSGAELGTAALAAGGLASVLTVWRQLGLPAGLAQVVRLWRLGRWLASENLLYGVSNYGVWLLLVSRAGPGVAGGLRAGQQLFMPIQTALIGLNTVMLGRFARLREGQARAGALLICLEVGVVAAWGSLLVALGPKAIAAIFGPAFQLPRRDLGVLTAALMATAVFELTALRLRAVRQVRPLVMARAASSAVVLAGTALIGTSVIGVAVALLGGSLLGGSLLGVAAVRGRYRRRPRAAVPRRHEVAGCEARERIQAAE